jgi:GNAT superfamily N-acetyltransferase
VAPLKQVIARLWEDNQEWLRERLGPAGDVPFPARWIYTPEIPSPKFNHVSSLILRPGRVTASVNSIRRWFHQKGMPFASILVTPATYPADLGSLLESMGWSVQTTPVLLRSRRVRVAPNDDIVVRVAEAGDDETFFRVMERVFLDGAPGSQLELGRRNVRMLRELGGRNYLAYYKESLSGIGSLLSRAGMGGIYNLGTLPVFRGKGLARAVLDRMIRDAEQEGNRWVCLTPTPVSRRLYAAMGFEEIFEERYYVCRF